MRGARPDAFPVRSRRVAASGPLERTVRSPLQAVAHAGVEDARVHAVQPVASHVPTSAYDTCLRPASAPVPSKRRLAVLRFQRNGRRGPLRVRFDG